MSSFLARVEDVSLNGMRIAAGVELRPGDRHWFRIEHRADESVRLRGEIAWVRRSEAGEAGFEAGVSFAHLTRERAVEWLRLLGS